MKFNRKQAKTLDGIIRVLSFWKDSNDIESPKHYNEVPDILKPYKLEKFLNEKQVESIEHFLIDILITLKSIK